MVMKRVRPSPPSWFTASTRRIRKISQDAAGRMVIMAADFGGGLRPTFRSRVVMSHADVPAGLPRDAMTLFVQDG